MDDNAIEAVINEHEKIAEQLGEKLHGSPPEDPSSVDRASAWLTARIFISPMRYATFNVAQPDTTDESLPSGSLSSSRRKRGMPGCSIKRMGSPRSSHGTGTPNPSISKRPMRTSPSSGRVATASRVRHSCTLTPKREGPEPSWDT